MDLTTLGCILVASLTKIKPKSKVKIKNRVNSIIIDKSKLEGSGIGATTLNNGLIYGNYPYGTRVEDEDISLNVPDIVEIYGIFESSGTTEPSAPSLTLQTINSSIDNHCRSFNRRAVSWTNKW